MRKNETLRKEELISQRPRNILNMVKLERVGRKLRNILSAILVHPIQGKALFKPRLNQERLDTEEKERLGMRKQRRKRELMKSRKEKLKKSARREEGNPPKRTRKIKNVRKKKIENLLCSRLLLEHQAFSEVKELESFRLILRVMVELSFLSSIFF